MHARGPSHTHALQRWRVRDSRLPVPTIHLYPVRALLARTIEPAQLLAPSRHSRHLSKTRRRSWMMRTLRYTSGASRMPCSPGRPCWRPYAAWAPQLWAVQPRRHWGRLQLWLRASPASHEAAGCLWNTGGRHSQSHPCHRRRSSKAPDIPSLILKRMIVACSTCNGMLESILGKGGAVSFMADGPSARSFQHRC